MRGLDLRVMRVGRRIETRQIAREMGVSSSRVSHIEKADIVTVQAEARYLEALARLTPDKAA